MHTMLSGATVLVVSRREQRAASLVASLTRSGARGHGASAPSEALPALILEPFDAVVFDLDVEAHWSAVAWIGSVRALPYPEIASIRAIAFGDPVRPGVLDRALTDRQLGFDALVLSTSPSVIVDRLGALMLERAA